MKRLVWTACALLAIVACRGENAPEQPALTAVQRELAALAERTAAARYTATYSFAAPATKDTGTIRIVASPPQYRVDITTPGKTAIFIASTRGTYSCAAPPRRKTTCLLVARPGEAVPQTFDPGVQHLFSDAVRELAKHPAAYSVSALADVPAIDAVPAARCYRVERVGSPPPADASSTGFETGDYCFAERGLLTSVRVATGDLVLVRVGRAPAPKDFTPPATPAVLPDLTSPTPR